MRVKALTFLVLIMPALTMAQDETILPDEAFLEFLGSFELPEDDLLDIAIEAVEQEQEEGLAGKYRPAEDRYSDKL